MAGTTTHYNLAVYDSGDTTVPFLTYRLAIAGSSSSNMTIIDTALDDHDTAITALQATLGLVLVEATHGGSGAYTATVGAITAYDDGMFIVFKPDASNPSPGTSTLNINSLGSRTLVKPDPASGSSTNLFTGDVPINSETIFRYDLSNTEWVLVGRVVSRVQEEGSDLAIKPRLNFVGDSVTATANTNAIDVTINGAVLGKNEEILSTTKTLTNASDPIQCLDVGGAERKAILPTIAGTNPFYIIVNTGSTYNLLARDAGDTITIATIKPDHAALIVSDGGGDWYVISETFVDPLNVGMPSGDFIGVLSSSDTLLNTAIKTLDTYDWKHDSGRLTLTTAVPVTTSDVSSATTLYFTPYKGNKITLYTGATDKWVTYEFTQMSLSNSGFTSSKPHDIFLDWNSGTPALDKLAWTNDTTRATALVAQDGRWVLTGDTEKNYIGTVYADASGNFNDTNKLRYVWNYMNRLFRPFNYTYSTSNWTYTSQTWRQANASSTNQVDFVIGLSEEPVIVTNTFSAVAMSATLWASVGFGLDSTTALASDCIQDYQGGYSTNFLALRTKYQGYPGIGKHYLAMIERVEGATVTFYGTGSSEFQKLQGGIYA